MSHVRTLTVLCFAVVVVGWRAAAPSPASSDEPGWRKGVGWGWIWGEDDEVGALNSMNESMKKL